MTYRGFDDYLRTRVVRAGSHYLDDDTLRFFNAYGGRKYGSSSADTVIVVESVQTWDHRRMYRPVVFRFTTDAYGRDVKCETYATDIDRAFASPKGAQNLAAQAYSMLASHPTDKTLAAFIGDGIAQYMMED